MVEKKTNRALDFLELPVDRRAGLTSMATLSHFLMVVVDVPETHAGWRTVEMSLREAVRALQTEQVDCVTALRQEGSWLIKEQKGGSEAGWGEAERAIDHRRLEQNLPILGSPVLNGSGP